MIDHSTLSEFRRKNGEELKDLFVQIVMIAHKMGLVCFTQMAFGGTRIRASNHRHRPRTPAELRTLQEELAKRMRSEAGKKEYAKRRAPGERPFGGIKQHFGVRQFL